MRVVIISCDYGLAFVTACGFKTLPHTHMDNVALEINLKKNHSPLDFVVLLITRVLCTCMLVSIL